jgi:hypothetical protein
METVSPTNSRGMTSLPEALKFLVRLAQADVSHLKRGDLLNLCDDLRAYLNIEVNLSDDLRAYLKEGEGRIEKDLRKAETDPSVLNETVKTVLEIVKTVADRGKAHFTYGKGEYILDASAKQIVTYEGSSLRDAILHSAMGDVEELEQAHRIKRCPRCSRFFYGQTNQLYCGRVCAGAVAVKRYREKKSGDKATSKRLRKGTERKTEG